MRWNKSFVVLFNDFALYVSDIHIIRAVLAHLEKGGFSVERSTIRIPAFPDFNLHVTCNVHLYILRWFTKLLEKCMNFPIGLASAWLSLT